MGPICIGDVGTFTLDGFVALENLYDCRSASLQDPLSLLPLLSEVWRNPEYLAEGQSITGGVSECVTIHREGP
jgi:hypothetical protein